MTRPKASDGKRLSAERLAEIRSNMTSLCRNPAQEDETYELLGHIAAVEAELAVAKQLQMALLTAKDGANAALKEARKSTDAWRVRAEAHRQAAEAAEAENARLRELIGESADIHGDDGNQAAEKWLRAALKEPV